MDSKYRELPSDIKLATFKEIFSMISHCIKRGYIDPFGVVTGISKNNAYLMKYEVSHPIFLSYFRNTLMDFDDIYTIFKEAKKNIRVTYDNNQINGLAIISEETNDIAFETPVMREENVCVEEVFRSYDNPNIFKETSVYDLDIQEFSYAIQNDYTFRANHYIITKEAVPKPKKLISGTYSISDIINESEESYIYYTTKLVYPDIRLMIASKVLNLD